MPRASTCVVRNGPDQWLRGGLGVDDEGEKLRDLSQELEGLRHDGGIGVSKEVAVGRGC
jgi:hypothetical protein